jgi:hypothetical protein
MPEIWATSEGDTHAGEPKVGQVGNLTPMGWSWQDADGL